MRTTSTPGTASHGLALVTELLTEPDASGKHPMLRSGRTSSSEALEENPRTEAKPQASSERESLALPRGRRWSLRSPLFDLHEVTEDSFVGASLEVVEVRDRLALVVQTPRSSASEHFVNGLPLPLLFVARPGDRLVLADGTSLCVVERLVPYIGLAPEVLAGATCATCLTSIVEGVRVVVCARCDAVQHWETDPAIPADDRLACASLAPTCPSCSESLTAREEPDVAD